MLIAHGLRGDNAIAESCGQFGDGGGDGAVAFWIVDTLWNCHSTVLASNQSAKNPEALTTGSHRAASAFWILPSSSALVPVGSRPTCISRSRTSGDLTASTIAL